MTPQKPENINCYFSAKMTISDNSRGLQRLPRLPYLTDDKLDSAKADESDVLKYLRQSKQI